MKNFKLFGFLGLLGLLITLNGCRKDPCDDIICLNEGYCANGICNCPTGYEGSDCGTESIPTSVKITQIVVSNYPVTTSTGAGWDVSSGADMYLSVNQGTTANLNNFTSGYAENVTGNSITYSTGFPTTITNPSVEWVIGLWDYDSTDSDDKMAGVYFTPNDYKSGFPSTINLTTASLSMTLTVEWEF